MWPECQGFIEKRRVTRRGQTTRTFDTCTAYEQIVRIELYKTHVKLWFKKGYVCLLKTGQR